MEEEVVVTEAAVVVVVVVGFSTCEVLGGFVGGSGKREKISINTISMYVHNIKQNTSKGKFLTSIFKSYPQNILHRKTPKEIPTIYKYFWMIKSILAQLD